MQWTKAFIRKEGGVALLESWSYVTNSLGTLGWDDEASGCWVPTCRRVWLLGPHLLET